MKHATILSTIGRTPIVLLNKLGPRGVNVFMKRFKKLGYIEYSGGLKVNDSLVRVILRDERVGTRPSKTG